MKKEMLKILVGVVLVAGLVGCAKPPTEEVNASQIAIQAVITEGANVYAKEELAGLQKEVNAVQDEIKVQDNKLFKNFDKAKEAALKAKVDADALKTVVIARKEEAKKKAMADLVVAKEVIAEAKGLLANAPKGKGSKADIEAMGADLNGLNDSLVGVQALIDSNDYLGASDKAGIVTQKANEVATQVKTAISKVKKPSAKIIIKK
jgi:hypothetical protein